MQKKFKDLNLNSSFLFAAALSDPEICQLVLEIILGRTISKVNVKSENSILLSLDAKCVRLDVNARDEFSVNYDIEAQNKKESNIVKRSRYYQAEMDVAELKPGDDYDKLPDSYVIFICTFDPFGKGLYQYTFSERCEQNGMYLGDGTHKIFLNTKGRNVEHVSQELIHFLKYFENSTDNYVSTVNDKSIRMLHSKICELKMSREWEAGYMKMTELLEETQKEGIELGIKQGERQKSLKMLYAFLADKGGISADLKEKLESEQDESRLDMWVMLAARVPTIKEFEKNM